MAQARSCELIWLSPVHARLEIPDEIGPVAERRAFASAGHMVIEPGDWYYDEERSMTVFHLLYPTLPPSA